MGASVAGVGNSFGRAAAGIAIAGAKLAAFAVSAGALAGGMLAGGVLRTAATFEDLGATLATIEGSSAKAKGALAWVSDFAAKTPYDIGGVSEAFVRLRAYGLDPTNGLLQTLGDTASAMGQPLMQAVEAIADAVNGENERLKRFDIAAAKHGNKIAYSYIANGKQITRFVDANNKAQIASTLQAIWNSRFAGAMEARSKTWNGMMSNVGDQWTRFQRMIADSGPFEEMKGALAGLLATLDRMAADGSLQALADRIGGALVAALRVAGDLLRAVIDSGRALGETLAWAVPLTDDLARAFAWVVPVADALARALGPLDDVLRSIGAELERETRLLAGFLTLLGKGGGWLAGKLGLAAPAAATAPLAAQPPTASRGALDITLSGAPAGSRVTQIKPPGGFDLGLTMGPAMARQ
ncbi:MAG: tape measure protein [Rhodospirillales bacterium]|nr:tape measure protein [Rhodospirillales bacterium]